MRMILQRQDVALSHRLLRVRDAAVDQLRDVDQAFDGTFDTREGAEGRELRDDARHDLADLVLVDDAVPVRRLRPADAQRDLLLLGVDLHYIYVDFVADLEELLGRLRAVPGDLGKVHEAVGAAEVDEDAEAADRADAALADLALFELRQQPVFLLLRHSCSAPRSERMTRLRRRLSSMTLSRSVPADGRREAGAGVGTLRPQADELATAARSRDALDIDQEAALVEAGDFGLEALAAFVQSLQRAPAALAARPVEGEEDFALRSSPAA